MVEGGCLGSGGGFALMLSHQGYRVDCVLHSYLGVIRNQLLT
jgi:hypothetical protein